MDIIKIFADNVKNYRKDLGITQEELAERAGLHRTYISQIERYKRSISLENIQRLADALRIDAFMLFVVKEEKSTYEAAIRSGRGKSE
jgi:transcriptional regulator with XRE-family HTH domain